MKLINKLEKSNLSSVYSGQATRNVEMSLRPVPEVDENGMKLKKAQRYYVFRLLFFTGENRTDFPAIIRNEHTFYQKDSAGNIKGVKRICCPTTMWARQRIQEPVDKDYCPICKYSFEQNTEGWKNYRTLQQIDKTCLKLADETSRQWAAYFPVLVVSDPLYKNNNNHLRVLRLAGDEGKAAYKKISDLIFEAQSKNINVFNGDEGANIGILCEKCEKVRTNKKTGEPVINRETGEPYTYMANCITDIRLMTKNLHEYSSFVTESAIENLHFDDTFGAVATKNELAAFLRENYLVHEVSDADFEEDEFSDEAEEEKSESIVKPVQDTTVETVEEESSEDDGAETTSSAETGDDFDEDEPETVSEVADAETVEDADDSDEDDEFANESARDAIARITKGRTVTATAAKATVTNAAVKKVASVQSSKSAVKATTGTKFRSSVPMKPAVEKMRDTSLDIDPEDLPF